MKLLDLYESLEKLVVKLPGPLQKPILKEITPIKDLFLRRRPPRFVLLGNPEAPAARVLGALFHDEPGFGDNVATQRTPGWQRVTHLARGKLSVLDARLTGLVPLVKNAISAEPPDFLLFLATGSESEDAWRAPIEMAAQFADLARGGREEAPSFLGLILPRDGERETEEVRARLDALLRQEPRLGDRLLATVTVPPMADPDSRPDAVEQMVQIMAGHLPDEAKLEMARLCGLKSVQMQIARVLINSVTAICTAIGTQPIPLADFPFLTSLQGLMVAGIIHISGRDLTSKLATEFIAAMGANVGAGLVLREGSRALLKLLPGWGNAISGAIAGAGTYAVGKAAMAYFIEGISLEETRRLFRRTRSRPSIPNE